MAIPHRSGGKRRAATNAARRGIAALQQGAAEEALAHLARAIAGAAHMSSAALALASVLAEDGVASVVIGVTDADEMRANAQAAGQNVAPAAIAEARAAGQGLPLAMIDPRQWPT